jgi:uncharacterized membrane protein YccC
MVALAEAHDWSAVVQLGSLLMLVFVATFNPFLYAIYSLRFRTRIGGMAVFLVASLFLKKCMQKVNKNK